MDSLAQIDQIMQDCGLPLWGVCPFYAVAEKLLPCRGQSKLPAQAVSVLCVLFPYLTEEDPNRNISRYAVPPDYHEVANRMLENCCNKLSKKFINYKFQHFVDNSPIPEVFAAASAGLGVIGQNGLLIHERYGSWVFIGEIVTDLPLPVFLRDAAFCIGCGACQRACPTGALSPQGLNREKCLSAITQQKKALSPEQEEQIRESGCVWGCDRCQEVCPMNRGAEQTPLIAFLQGAVPTATEEAASLPDRAYLWRGKQVFLRNLALVNKK